MLKWLLRAGQHGLAQGVAQCAALVTGILIVRAFTKTEYAQYSIITTMLPAIANVADSGIGAVLLSRGQASRDDEAALSRLYRVALNQRWRLAIPVVGVSLVWMAVLLVHAGSGDVIGLLFLAVLILFPTINIGVLQVFHRVHLDVKVLRRAIMFPALARLVLTGGLFFADAISIWTLLVMTFLTTAANALYLRRSARIATYSQPADAELVRGFRSAIGKVLPMTLAAVATSQALVGFMTIKGSPEMLAEFSAVSRFGLAFSLFLPIVADIVAPSIARLPNIRKVLLRHVLRAFFVCVAVVVVGTGAVALASGLLLKLLGPRYESLELALVLVFLGYGVTFLGYAMSAVAQSRNWLAGSWAYVPLAVVWLLVAALIPAIPSTVAAAGLFLTQSGLLVATQAVRIGLGLRRTPAD